MPPRDRQACSSRKATAWQATAVRCPPVIRPESQTAPVEAKVKGTRPQIAAAPPNTFQVRAKVAATSRAYATVPPLTRVLEPAPQSKACGSEYRTGTIPTCGVPG